MRFIVYHSMYGCDTGCCGHIVKAEDGTKSNFFFIHPNGTDFRTFAEELLRESFGEEHIKDLDWENCLILDD